MNNDYSKVFWTYCDELNKDTSFAYNFGEKVYNHQQEIINGWKDEYRIMTLKYESAVQRINNVIMHIEPSDELSHKMYREIVKMLKG